MPQTEDAQEQLQTYQPSAACCGPPHPSFSTEIMRAYSQQLRFASSLGLDIIATEKREEPGFNVKSILGLSLPIVIKYDLKKQ